VDAATNDDPDNAVQPLAERLARNVIGWRVVEDPPSPPATVLPQPEAARPAIKVVAGVSGRAGVPSPDRAAAWRRDDPAPTPPAFVLKTQQTDSLTAGSRSDESAGDPSAPLHRDGPKSHIEKGLALSSGPGPSEASTNQELADRPAQAADDGPQREAFTEAPAERATIARDHLAWRVLPAAADREDRRTGPVALVEPPPAPDFATTPVRPHAPPPTEGPPADSRRAAPPGSDPERRIARAPSHVRTAEAAASEGSAVGSLRPPTDGDPPPREFQLGLASKPIASVSVDITPPSGDFPSEIRLPSDPTGDAPPLDPLTNRGWAHSEYCWQATGLFHRPLYFEQPNMERYGYAPTRSRTGQSILAGAHFFGSVLILPYRMGAEPINDAVYTLGHYRPGSCVPYRFERPPLDWKGGALETVTLVGLIFAIP
jgi:hypothetical protein